MRSFIIIGLTLLSVKTISFAQEICENSFVDYIISNEYRGEIAWEFSNDSSNWVQYDSTNIDSVRVYPDVGTMYGRIRVEEQNCDPYYISIDPVRTIPTSVFTIDYPLEDDIFLSNEDFQLRLDGANHYEIYLEGELIDQKNGIVRFPVLEPFGSHLESLLLPEDEAQIPRLVYNELYEQIRESAHNVSEKNKFKLRIRYTGGSAIFAQNSRLSSAAARSGAMSSSP